jgi:hypothetical protein
MKQTRCRRGGFAQLSRFPAWGQTCIQADRDRLAGSLTQKGKHGFSPVNTRVWRGFPQVMTQGPRSVGIIFGVNARPVFGRSRVVVHKDIPMPVMHRITPFGARIASLRLWIEMGIADDSGFVPVHRRDVIRVHRSVCARALVVQWRVRFPCPFIALRVFHSMHGITEISAKWMMVGWARGEQDDCLVNQSCGGGLLGLGKLAG